MNQSCQGCGGESVAKGKTSFSVVTDKPKDAAYFQDITIIVCKDSTCGYVKFVKN